MLLGALADAGASEEAIRASISALHLPNCKISFARVSQGGLSAKQVTVLTPTRATPKRSSDLLELLESADLPERLKTKAKDIVGRIAETEAGIHNMAVESVHLHELGGDDTLVDIVGVLSALDDLSVESVFVSRLPLARGFTDSAHGQLPLPAPATLALLKDVPVRYLDIEAELVTPTGAAILTTISDGFGGFPAMKLSRVGIGSGQRRLPFPNVVRLWLGETETYEEGLIVETVTVVEANIDDMNPQVYGHLMERLFAVGALDVTLTPMQMKKNRPATLLGVICRPDAAHRAINIIFEETTTLGVRCYEVERSCLPRTIEAVETPFGTIRLKVTRWAGRTRKVPEYEDCRKAADANNVPLNDVRSAAVQAAR